MKKLLAFILTLSLLAGVLPLAAATETATEKYEFIFAKEGFGYTSTQTNNIIVNTSNLSQVTNGNKWKVAKRLGGASTVSAYLHRSNSFLLFGTTSASDTYTGTNDVNANALVVEIQLRDAVSSAAATDGVYIPSVENEQHRAQGYYGVLDLYLVPTTILKETNWSVDSIDDVNNILKNASKLDDSSWRPTSDVLHFYSANQSKDATDDVLTADKLELSGGNYYLIATVSKPKEWVKNKDTTVSACFSNITFTREADDTVLTGSFTSKEDNHTPAAKNVYGYKSTDKVNPIVEYKAVTADKVTVSTTDTENFLYWAQGMTDEKKILSFSPSFDYTPSEGNNILVAVYKDTENKAEFFNANGQRESYLLEDGVAPSLPERVGYAPATAWVDLNGNEVIPGEAVTVNGYNSYVPNYGERIAVTVNGIPYNYGDTVTLDCNDMKYYQEGKVFKGWKKDNVIVSVNKSYSFLAYKDTTVEAVWSDAPFNFSGDTRKIILDAFNGALMAEFIGFGNNVSEKGIMFTDTTGATRNLTMTTSSNQFVIIPDDEGTYKGYAVVKDDEGTKLITDGKYDNTVTE